MKRKQFIFRAAEVKDSVERQYKYLYQKMLGKDLIRRAWRKLRKGKTKRKEVQEIDADLENQVERMRLMIENTKPPGVEVPHPELAFKPEKHEPRRICEHGKWRTLYKPSIIEQWLHHIIVLVLEPIILGSADHRACGSLPGRGPHYGKRKIEKWIRKFPNMMNNYGKFDIRHFYDSIRHVIILNELRRKIADEWFLYIIMLCLSEFKKGLPLGYYISQWIANYLLEPIDALMSKYFPRWVRYMDDITIFAKYLKQLYKILKLIRLMLWRRLWLKLKKTRQIVEFDRGDGKHGRCLDFMGFVFYWNHTSMRRSILSKAIHLVHKISHTLQKGYKVFHKHASAILSYYGWFKHTNSHDCYEKYIKPYVNIRQMKDIISRIDRRDAHDRLDRNALNREAGRVLQNCA